MAELLRCLATLEAPARLKMLLALAEDALPVLNGHFAEESKTRLSAWAAQLVGAPVHENVCCGRCGAHHIVGPRFQAQGFWDVLNGR